MTTFGTNQLRINSFGQLVLTGWDGKEHVNVEAVRAFPITAADEGVSLVAENGHELAWIPSIKDLEEPHRTLIRERLAVREFVPEIRRIKSVSGFTPPCTWQVETDRGETRLLLNAEEDIRRLSGTSLLVMDGRSIQFLIRNPQTLDAASRKILDRFM